MGRTQRTYRQRLLEIRDRMLKQSDGKLQREEYKQLWVSAHKLSAPSSTFPWPDTNAVATFCMILDAMVRLNELEIQLNKLKSEKLDISNLT